MPPDDRFTPRPGEVRLGFDPAARAEVGLVFIGRIRTPWGPRDAPKNLRQARERGQAAWLEIAPDYRAGLEGLAAGGHVVLLYWMDRAPRDLIRQLPRHRDTATGVFSLRSPVRPNPLGMAVVRITDIDASAGHVGIDAIDAWDGTPLIDIKPWLPSVDVPPEAG
jgi:tRNA-Thr(GGU) m(6)t(6)A37 methyltransferase TsaA